MRRDRIGKGLLAVAGLINVLPGIGAVSATWARSAYGVDVDSADLEVLLRHRAVLFAVVGSGLLVAVFRPGLRTAAVTANAISFGSFLALAATTRPLNAAMVRIAWIDVAAVLVLAAGAVLTADRSRQRD